jgi:hypothetical protein
MLEIDRHQTNRKKEKISGSAGLKGKNSEESAGTDITKAMNRSEGIIDITDAPDVAAWNKTMQSKGVLHRESDSQTEQKQKDQFRSQ